MYPPDTSCIFNFLRLSIIPDQTNEIFQEAGNLFQNNSIDWDELYRSSKMHSLRPQVMNLLNKIPSISVPKGFSESINYYCRQNLYNQLNYIGEFFRIRNFLRKENIEIIPFKGFSLTADVYDNLADRESGDVDVFIKTDDLSRIRELMMANCYVPEEYSEKLSLKEILRKDQEYCFERIEDGKPTFRIEFHWGICPPDYGMDIRFEDLIDQTETKKIQNEEFTGLTPSAHLLLVIFHHGGKDKFFSLRHTCDIARILNKYGNLDWSWIIKMSEKYHAERLIYTGINLANSLTGIKVPSDIAEYVGSGKIRKLAENRILHMKHNLQYGNKVRYDVDNWLFRMRSRTGVMTNIRSTAATLRFLMSKIISS